MVEGAWQERVAVALDADTLERNVAVVQALAGRARWFKVGLRWLLADPAPLVRAIEDAGASLFVDPKLYDIPATMRGGALALSRWSPRLLTVHVGAGPEGVGAVLDGLEAGGAASCRVVVVTRLTSKAWREERWETLEREVGACLAAGAAGGVCSGHEVTRWLGVHPGSHWVTPGIRLEDERVDDQARVVTPAAALEAGAGLLVIGRPVVRAASVEEAWERLGESLAHTRGG